MNKIDLTCTDCKGTGKVEYWTYYDPTYSEIEFIDSEPSDSESGGYDYTAHCDDCNGTGELNTRKQTLVYLKCVYENLEIVNKKLDKLLLKEQHNG